MSDTMLRHWEMLRQLPRERGKISTAQLEERLAEFGHPVTQRTIQRDLRDLSRLFPISCDERTKPFSWYWTRTAVPFDIPGMDLHTALAFRLAADHLAHLLPTTTRAYLEPHMRRARAVLEEAHGGPLAAWPENVLAIPGGLPLQPPEIIPEVLEAVHLALLQQRCLKVQYRSRGAQEARELELHPLGLVYRDAVAYLLATAWDFEDVRQYVLHRLVKATLTEQPSRVPDGFDVRTYVERDRALEFPLGRAVLPLVAAVEEFLATKMAETPLARDQLLSPLPDGRYRLSATVHDTVQLRIWLQSQGGYIEVLEPAALREEIAAELERALERYRPVAAAAISQTAP